MLSWFCIVFRKLRFCCYIVLLVNNHLMSLFFFFKQKTAYDMRISDWSSDVCSSDLIWVIPGLGWRAMIAIGAVLGFALLPLTWRLLPESASYLQEIGRASCRERVCQYV